MTKGRVTKPLRLIFPIAVFLFLCAPTHAKDHDTATATMKNGRFWALMTTGQRLSYVLGCLDGLKVGIVISSDTDDYQSFATRYQKYLSTQSIVGEVVKGVDQFYQDPANASIDIAQAMFYFRMKVDGAGTQELADVVAGWRKNNGVSVSK